MNNNKAQALVEYLIIFAFMGLIGGSLAKNLAVTVDSATGSLATVLTNELTVGVCPLNCYYDGYKNQPR